MGRELTEEEKTSIKDLEAKLLTHKHILKIEHDPRWHIPNIDYSKFDGKDKEIAEIPVKMLKKFLRNPYIEDDFSNDHDARREWRDKLEDQYKWFHDFYQHNSLKYSNQCATLRNALALMKDFYGDSDKEDFEAVVDKAHKLCKMNPLEYNQKSLQDKIGYIKQIKHAVYDILDYVSCPKCSIEEHEKE